MRNPVPPPRMFSSSPTATVTTAGANSSNRVAASFSLGGDTGADAPGALVTSGGALARGARVAEFVAAAEGWGGGCLSPFAPAGGADVLVAGSAPAAKYASLANRT